MIAMKLSRWIRLGLIATALAAPFVHAQDGRKSIVVTKIAATDALLKRMSNQGVTLSIESVLQALDAQVYDRLVNTRRFNVLERSDADALLEEAGARRAGRSSSANRTTFSRSASTASTIARKRAGSRRSARR